MSLHVIGNGKTMNASAYAPESGWGGFNKAGVLTDTELHDIGVIRPADNKVYKQDR